MEYQLQTITITRDLTQADRLELSDIIINMLAKIDEVELDKKNAAKEFSGRISEIDLERRMACRDLRNGFIEEDKQCFIRINTQAGTRDFFDALTGDLIKEETLEEQPRQMTIFEIIEKNESLKKRIDTTKLENVAKVIIRLIQMNLLIEETGEEEPVITLGSIALFGVKKATVCGRAIAQLQTYEEMAEFDFDEAYSLVEGWFNEINDAHIERLSIDLPPTQDEFQEPLPEKNKRKKKDATPDAPNPNDDIH